MKVTADNLNNRLLALLPDLERFALSLTRNRSEAEDLVQEASARVMQKGIPEGADLRRWAFRVCKNLWFDQLRKKKVRLDAANRVAVREPIAHDGAAELESRSELGRVMRIMEQMLPDQQIALSLIAIEGMTYREVAQVLEIPIGTVTSRVARARAIIADQLASEPDWQDG